jgi:hypothetical protein
VSTGIIVLYFSTQHFLFAPGASGLASLRLSAGELFLKPSAGQSAFSYKKVLNYFHCFATQRVPSSYPITFWGHGEQIRQVCFGAAGIT